MAAEDAAPSAKPVSRTPPALPSSVSLERGAIRSFLVQGVARLAIGDPSVVDVTAVSSSELLMQARASGRTNLIVWDQQGQRVVEVEVVDRAAEAPEAVEAQLIRLVEALGLPDASVKREQHKVFIVGEVARQEDFDRIEHMLATYPSVTNLLNVVLSPVEPVAPPPKAMVRLDVQVLEVNRTDVDKLGVKWSESVAFTEPELADQLFTKAITHFGTSYTRSSFAATLNALVKRNRARVLAEPKLVTASGKEASSFIGVEVPVVTATSFGTTTSTVSTSIEFRETGVLLRMTPFVQSVDGSPRITTTITAELSDLDTSVALSVPVGSQTVSVPGFKVRKANTEVTTASGESIVIAGLLESKDTHNVTQVPAMGSIPVLGRLFRNPEKELIQREVMIIVTPDLLTPLASAKGQAPAAAQDARTAELEQALDVAQVTVIPSVSDPILRYALTVQERVGQAIKFPQQQEPGSPLGGRVKLRLHLFRDGTLGRAVVAESSGIQPFDTEAVKAAELQSPYPPFPSSISQEDLWLEIPVVFNP